MKLDRTLNTRDKKRLSIIHHSGASALESAKPERIQFKCGFSLVSYINTMRSRGVLHGDVEDLETIELTDEGRKLIGE